VADNKYDLIIIGGGPGGYVAAVRADQLGLKTAVVEHDVMGGRCLNYACIPAKTMLYTAELYDHAQNSADFGVKAEKVTLDWQALAARRDKVRKTLTGGVAGLMKSHNVEVIEGTGSVTDDGNVRVGGKFDGPMYETGAVIIATGSVARSIPGADFGGRIVDTWGAWSLPDQPKKLAVVGAGASGAEIASAYGRFGTEVILLEMLPQILPNEDSDVAKVVERAFKKQNIEVVTGTAAENIEAGKNSVKFTYGDKSAEVDYLCIATGRGPDTEALALDEAGIKTEENGQIAVDEFQRTSLENVYAIGDLVRGPALAHKASDEGVVAVETIAGVDTHPVDIEGVPGATFCHPQVGSIGLTEAEAKETGREIKVGKFQLGGIGAGTVYDDRAGFVKIVGDAEYGEILGAHIVGNRACDMISELVNAKALEGGYQEVARIIHPHPTLSEAVMEAARAADGWVTHG
jgi:dihydrolipoamide dehydrogenase